MPGYDITRFVGAQEAELALVTCTICSDVFCNPLVTSCCGQTFCESCIKTWIDSNHTCPFDSKPLKVDNLIPPTKTITTLMNKFKIKCAHAAKGCHEVFRLPEIENHQKYCMYDKELCKVCGFVSRGEHDCLKSLVDYKAKMTEIMDKLHKELESSNLCNKGLRAQMGNYMRTIQDLIKEKSSRVDNVAPKAAKSAQEKLGVNSNKDILLEARKFINNPIVDGHRTKKNIVDKLLEVMKEALCLKGDKIYDVTKFIKEYMDSNFMGDWNCYLLYNNIGYVFHNILNEGFVEIKYGKVWVTVYKTYDALGFTRLINFIKSGAVRDFACAKTGFDASATAEIEKVAFASLKTANNMNEFTESITTELARNYGGVWHCFIYKSNFGFYCVRSDSGKFVLFSCFDIKILIFQ